MHSQRWILCFIVQSKVSNPLLVSKGRGGLGKIPRAFSPQGRRVLTGLGRGPGSCILGIVLFVWRRRTGIWGSAFLFLLGDGIISTTVLSILISGGVCGWAVNTSNSGSGSQVQALPVAFFPQTRKFTPLCLSSPRCINGYRRHTAGGVTLRWTSIPSSGRSNTPRLASCYGNRK